MDLSFNNLPKWSVFDSAPVPIAIVDAHGKFIDVNERWAEYLGYSREELKTMNYSQITHPEDIIGESIEVGKIILDASKQTKTYTKRYISKDGQDLKFKLAFSTINNPDGVVVGFVSWILPIESSLKYVFDKRNIFMWIIFGFVVDIVLLTLLLLL
jgi:PAS domain S-box-containing protein